jgi:formate dehydrogenase subunit gamma
MTDDAAKAAIIKIVADKESLPGALLPILHDIQHQFGYIPKLALTIVAQALKQTSAEIYGVVSFYAHFRMEKTGQHIIEVCRGEACQAMGSAKLEQAIKDQLNVDYKATTTDRNFTLEPVYCLGNCACAPSVKVGEHVFGRMNSEKFIQLTDKFSRYEINLEEHK